MTDPQLRTAISETLVKWNMPTRQAAITEIMQLIEQEITTATLRGAIQELAKTGLAGMPELTPRQQDYITKRLGTLKQQLEGLENGTP